VNQSDAKSIPLHDTATWLRIQNASGRVKTHCFQAEVPLCEDTRQFRRFEHRCFTSRSLSTAKHYWCCLHYLKLQYTCRAPIGCGMDVPGSVSRQVQELFLVTKTYPPALGPTSLLLSTGQLLALWVTWLRRDANHLSTPNAEVQNEGSYIFLPPLHLYGVQRKYYIFHNWCIFILGPFSLL